MIDGVGGTFLFSNDPRQLAAWYTDNLGVRFEYVGDPETGPYGHVYYGLDPDDRERKLDTTFAIMRARPPLPRWTPDRESDDMYGGQPFMLNLRVRDLEAVLAHLAAKGVMPLKREDYPYGRFAWVRDADGNRVELYQPLARS